MKVLFVSSGNNKHGINPIIERQGRSIANAGVSISYFNIKGKSISGYVKNIFLLRRYLKKNKFDLIHAHYSLSGITVTLSFAKTPLIMSLMGSDIQGSTILFLTTKIFAKLFWSTIIVKSEEMQLKLGLKNIDVIPNGVDLNVFNCQENITAKENLGFTKNDINVLFIANPERQEKNFKLAKAAVDQLSIPKVKLHTLYDRNTEDIVNCLCTCNLLMLTSLREGSPNVIKEAMACNLPIVSTNVGDVKWLLGDLDNHYITSFDPKEIADKIKLVLQNPKRTEGRERLIELGLDSETVANKIKDIYTRILGA